MFLEKLAIVSNACQLLALDLVQCICQCHITMSMMMTVGFTIGCDVHELRPVALLRKSAQQSLRELLAVLQQALEGHSLRDGPVVKEQINGSSRRQPAAIGASRVNVCAVHVFPFAAANFSHACR